MTDKSKTKAEAPELPEAPKLSRIEALEARVEALEEKLELMSRGIKVVGCYTGNNNALMSVGFKEKDLHGLTQKEVRGKCQ